MNLAQMKALAKNLNITEADVQASQGGTKASDWAAHLSQHSPETKKTTRPRDTAAAPFMGVAVAIAALFE